MGGSGTGRFHISPMAITPFTTNNKKLKTNNLSWRRRSRLMAYSQKPTGSDGGGEEVFLPLLHQQKKCQNKARRVFFLDVNPLCYIGSTPSLHSFANWLSLFFSQVSLSDPVVAVVEIPANKGGICVCMRREGVGERGTVTSTALGAKKGCHVLDGERGNEYRRELLPSYKAHRRKFSRKLSAWQRFSRADDGSSHCSVQLITDVLQKCNVPVLRIEDYEADDVVATLIYQVLQRGFRGVIGSPDKDFKQLISEDVQIVMPMPEFGRWSFYTLKHYIAQYNCNPSSDLSLRCIMGDEADGVPGIQHLVPGFGRKTALKLLKKHGSLENLLNAAAIRTVGKQYAQDALTKHADYLRKNYKVLSLRRHLDILLEEEWLSDRDTCNDSAVLSSFIKKLGDAAKIYGRNASYLVHR